MTNIDIKFYILALCVSFILGMIFSFYFYYIEKENKRKRKLLEELEFMLKVETEKTEDILKDERFNENAMF